MNNIRLLIFSDLLPSKQNTTAGTFVINRIRALKNNNIDVLPVKLSNVLYSHRIINDYSLNFYSQPINFKTINYMKFRYKGNFETAADRLYKLYRKFDRNLLHIHFGFPEGYIGYILKMKYNIPYVLTVHGSDIHTIPFKNVHYREMVLYGLNHAEHVIFVSNALLETARGFGFANSKFSIIPGGVNLEDFIVRKKPIKKYKVITFIGHLEKIKGADLLPLIFHKINKHDGNVKFKIIGDGKLKKIVVSRLKELNIYDKTEIKGVLPHKMIPKELNESDLLILPSRNEGFPSIILESLASGTPVVASSVGGIPKIVKDSINGIPVEKGNSFVDRFSKSIVKALVKEWNSKNIRNSVLIYDWKNVIGREIKIYEGILRK